MNILRCIFEDCLLDRGRTDYIMIIGRLAMAAEYLDNNTGVHIRRIALYTKLLAEEIKIEKKEAEFLSLASVMRNIGNIVMPTRILLKPEKLTKDEYEVIKLHPLIGARLLADSEDPLLQNACHIALHHHERFDGQGYPYRIKGDSIPLHSRILMICDIFEALISERPYRKAFDSDQARQIMQQEIASYFDPNLLDIFLSLKNDIQEIIYSFPAEDETETFYRNYFLKSYNAEIDLKNLLNQSITQLTNY